MIKLNKLEEEEVELVEKKKKKPYSSKTYTTGDPDLNIAHFNKMLTGKEDSTHTSGYLNGTFKNSSAEAAAKAVGTFASASPDGASSISTGDGTSSSGDGGIGESLDLDEGKRYVRRYYMKPQNIWLSNKDEVLKALIDHEDEDCIIYTLNNLGDTKDQNKLTSNDIIYYYEDGILYDKNHVRIFDYELSIKHEEERPRINPEQVSDAKLAAVYQDRMTGATNLDEVFTLDFNELAEDVDDNKCVICGKHIIGYGNNAAPVQDGRCCDECNTAIVLPARINTLKNNNIKETFSVLQYPIAVQKMQDFNNGIRKENLKACGDQKLVDYYDICTKHNFSIAKRQIEAELVNRGMSSFINQATSTSADTSAPKYIYTEKDFNSADAQFIKDNANNFATILANIFGTSLPIDEKLKLCISDIILALTIKENSIATELKNAISNRMAVDEVVTIINTAIDNPSIANRLAMIKTTVGTTNNTATNNNITEEIEKHNKLNPKLWNEDNTLKVEVKDKINDIVKTFTDGLDDKEIRYKLDDIKLVGSNCSYNYNKDSDLDLHLVFDLNIYDDEEKQEMAEIIYDYARSNWNNNHDIYFYDIPVEIFVETNNTEQLNDEQPVQEAKQKTALKSNGVYSVMNNTWIKEPVAEDIPEVDNEAFEKELKVWEDRAKDLLDDSEEKLDESVLYNNRGSTKTMENKKLHDKNLTETFDYKKLDFPIKKELEDDDEFWTAIYWKTHSTWGE